MDVSVIIINYNTIRLTIQCIQSILDFTTGVTYEIIVIDNNSGDDIEAAVAEHFGGCDIDITCKKLDGNIGFGRANNEGFKIAHGRNVFCLNPDTILKNNAIKILSDFIDAHPEAGVCGGNIYSLDMQPNHSFKRFLPGFEWEWHLLTFQKFEKLFYGNGTEFNNTGKPMEVGYITGADMMMRRSDAEHLGGFSPEFFMYYEETDLCLRMRKSGKKIVSVPEARIVHLEGASFGKRETSINKGAIERSEVGRLTYYRLNKSLPERCIINAVYRLALCVNKLYFKARGNDIWKYYEYKQTAYKEARKILKDKWQA